MWHCYYLNRVVLKQTLVIKNPQLSNLSLEHKSTSCPWFPEVSLIKAFITTHCFHIICLSEKFLDSTVSHQDKNIIINGYSLLRPHRPSNWTRSPCLCFKAHLPLIRRKGLIILQECLVTEIIVDHGKCFFACIYRSPNQNYEEFENFSSNLNLLLLNINDNHPLTGNFNSKIS